MSNSSLKKKRKIATRSSGTDVLTFYILLSSGKENGHTQYYKSPAAIFIVRNDGFEPGTSS